MRLQTTDEEIKRLHLIPIISAHVAAGTPYDDVRDEVATLTKGVVAKCHECLEQLFPEHLHFVSVLIFKHGGTYESKVLKWEGGKSRGLSLIWLAGEPEGCVAVLPKLHYCYIMLRY